MNCLSAWLPRMALLVALGFAGCAQPPFEVVRGGGSTEGGGYWFQAGGLFLKEGSPGILFGMAKEPGNDRELKYLVIFKHRATARSKVASPSAVNDEGKDPRVVKITDGVEIDGKGVSLALEIEVDPANKVTKRDELTLGGKKIDLSKGRVFLVDLTGAAATWEQVEAKLPTKPPDPTETKEVRELAQRVLTELPRDSKEVRDFLK